jgi:hypothetical protein
MPGDVPPYVTVKLNFNPVLARVIFCLPLSSKKIEETRSNIHSREIFGMK